MQTQQLLLCREWLREIVQSMMRACLDQVLLEQDFDDLLQDGQEPRVVHAHAALQHRQQRSHLHTRSPQLIIFLSQKSCNLPLAGLLCFELGN